MRQRHSRCFRPIHPRRRKWLEATQGNLQKPSSRSERHSRCPNIGCPAQLKFRLRRHMRLVPDQCNRCQCSTLRSSAERRDQKHTPLGSPVVAAGRCAVVGKVRGAGAIEEAAGCFDWMEVPGTLVWICRFGEPRFEEIKVALPMVGSASVMMVMFCKLAQRTALAISLEKYESELQTISPPEMVMSHDSFVNISPECHSGALWVATLATFEASHGKRRAPMDRSTFRLKMAYS